MKKALCILAILVLLPACGGKESDSHKAAEAPAKEKAGSVQEALYSAIRNDRLDEAKEIIKDSYDVSTTDEQGMTALHMAALEGELALAQLLVKMGANVNARNADERTALHFAADRDRTDVVGFLLANGADANARDTYSRTPLHSADRREIVDLLVKNGAALNARDDDGNTPLHMHIWSGGRDALEALLDLGAYISVKGRDGRTVLHEAVWKQDVELVKFLVDRGASLSIVDNDGYTPLHIAAFKHNFEILEFLFSKGADPDITNNEGEAVLHKLSGWLCQRRREYTEPFLKVAQLLARNGANLNMGDNSGRTPLHRAVENAYGHLVKFLLNSRVDMNLADSEGRTPLDVALGQHAFEVMMLLLENGAKCETTVPRNIVQAAMLGNLTEARKFIDAGEDVNSEDDYGRTALLYAAELGHTRIVELLIANGADMSVKDSHLQWEWEEPDEDKDMSVRDKDSRPEAVRTETFQFTPLHLAAMKRHLDVARLLIAAGGNVNATGGLFFQTPLDVAGSGVMKQLLRRHGAVSGKELKESREE